MAASHADSYILSTDVTFGHRVQQALITAAIAITTEAATVAYHYARFRFASQILNTPSSFVTLFTNSTATDPTCLGDATAAGTVVLTTANVAAQAALVTDVHMDNAVSSQFNSFLVPF